MNEKPAVIGVDFYRASINGMSYDVRKRAVVDTALSPEEARLLLKFNTSNRPLDRRQISLLKAYVLESKWIWDGCPISFNERGECVDGQHRLYSIAEGPESTRVPVVLIFGTHPNSFKAQAAQKPRTVAQAFAMLGITQANHKKLTVTNIMWGVCPQGRLDPFEAIDFYVAHKEAIERSFLFAQRLLNTGIALAPLPTVAALHYLFSQVDPARSDSFWSYVLAEDISGRTDAAFLLRKRLQINRDRKEKLPRNDIWKLSVKAWELKDREVGTLKLDVNDPLTSITPA